MTTRDVVSESRVNALERENNGLRRNVEALTEDVRELRRIIALLADDVEKLGDVTRDARAAFHHFQEIDRSRPHIVRKATRLR